MMIPVKLMEVIVHAVNVKKALGRVASNRVAVPVLTESKRISCEVLSRRMGSRCVVNFLVNYFSYGYPRKGIRQINSYVRQRLTQHMRRRSQRLFRPPEGVSYYEHFKRMGLVCL